jgi:hypothetical protein
VWQAKTLRRRRSGGDGVQEQLEAPAEDGDQAQFEAQAQAQEQGRGEIEEEGRLRQEGSSDGGCERHQLQLQLLC